MSPSKRLSVVKTGVICAAAYLAGIVLSPRVLPVDFLSSRLPRPGPRAAAGNPPTSGPDDGRGGASPTPAHPPATRPEENDPRDDEPPARTASPHEPSYRSVVGLVGDDGSDPFLGVDLVVHRNGEPDPCSRQEGAPEDEEGVDATTGGLSAASRALLRAADALRQGRKPIDAYTKYDVDAVLTHALAVGGEDGRSLLPDRGASCGPTWKESGHYMDHAPHLQGRSLSAMIKYCDMGLDRTTIQPDHHKAERLPEISSLPCHYHTREGVRVTSLAQLARLARDAKVPSGECAPDERGGADGTCGTTREEEEAAGGGVRRRRELHLYAVQMGRVFIFAPKRVGEVFELPHVRVPGDLPVWLEVLSVRPRVFDVYNFFDRAESAAIVDKALRETSETHRIKRSSTGASGYNVNSQRTSENGFDTHGKQAQAVKRRCMTILGFDEYEESLTDGLQVLRYNKTTAYIPHLDWIDDYQKQQEHNFDSEHLGSNRFATILLYMSDLEEGDGGETVFAHGWPAGQAEEDRVQLKDALAALRRSGDVEGVLARDSWEETMVAKCRSRLSVRPHSSRAVLFYSQNPDGTPDNDSMHGGCPVVSGEKWAANLWVWNAPRGGFAGSPVNEEVVKRNRAKGKAPDDGQKKASFTNTNTDEGMRNAQLYFQDTFWGKLGFSDPVLSVNTYEGHQWNVKVGGKTVKTFVITKKPMQMYSI